jgi:hypothetical protein
MYFRYLIFTVFVLVTSCGEKPQPEVMAATQADTVEVAVPVGDCYLLLQGKDSVLMQVVVENQSAAGQLFYRFFEKDKSGGKLFGNLRGDTLIADYKFIAEGTESEREVAFLMKGDTLYEGFGEQQDAEGRMVFKDLKTLRFDGKPMLKTDCTTLARYFAK